MPKLKMVLVDDEQSFVDAMSKRLDKRGVEVIKAFSGEEGLEKLDNVSGVDVVILDVKMPGMDGIETLGKIRKMHPLVEVIMLTGHATVQSAINGMKQGAFDYLMKPCDIEELLAKAREAKTLKDTHREKIAQARAMSIANRRGD